MSQNAQMRSVGGRRAKREVIDVAERKVEDRRLDQLLHVRKQRLGRLERERNEARNAWREQRQALRQSKQCWRNMLEQAKEQWQYSRRQFLQMTLTNGEFSKAKAVYKRMQQEAAQLYLACQEKLHRCRQAGAAFFEARRNVLEANRQQEKLVIMRDEIRALAQVVEN
jgi:hypothetical protein